MPFLTRAVLFADDVHGSAQVAEVSRRVGIVEQHGGRVLVRDGGALRCGFESATAAANAAVALIALRRTPGPAAVRVVVATGDVESIDGNWFGGPVELGRAMLSRVPGGEAWLDATTRACMAPSCAPTISLGEFALAGVPGRVELFRLVAVHQAWLPETVAAAARAGHLVRIRPDEPVARLSTDSVVVLEGFEPGSQALDRLLRSLPALPGGSVFLVAYAIDPRHRADWLETGRQLVVATPSSLESALARTRPAAEPEARSEWDADAHLDDPLGAGNHEPPTVVRFELGSAGLALPRVPIGRSIDRYQLDLAADGRWVAESADRLARLTIGADGVRVVAARPGVSVGGRDLAVGTVEPLERRVELGSPSGAWLWFPLMGGVYAGFLLAEPKSWRDVPDAVSVEIGREPSALDHLSLARRAVLLRDGDDISVASREEERPAWVLSGTRTMLEAAHPELRVRPGDRIVVGTAVLAVRRTIDEIS